MRNSTGGYKMRHESIGSQDSDNTSASGELELDDDMDTSTSPPLQQSR